MILIVLGTFDVGKQAFVLWEIADETFDGSSYLRFGKSAHQSYISEASGLSLSTAGKLPWYSCP